MKEKHEVDWFKHDINTQLDIKIRKLLRTEGYLGYGIYWHLVEALYKRGGRMEESEVKDELLLAGAEDILPTLLDVGLFSMEGSMVISERVIEQSQEALLRHQRYSEMGKASAERRLNASSTQVEPKLNAGSTDKIREEENIRKERHINVSKEKSDLFSDTKKRKLFSKPTTEEVRAYCRERNNGVDADKFFNFYESKNWYVGKNKMSDWKAAVRTWEQKSPTLRRIETDPNERMRGVNSDGSLNLLVDI